MAILLNILFCPFEKFEHPRLKSLLKTCIRFRRYCKVRPWISNKWHLFSGWVSTERPGTSGATPSSIHSQKEADTFISIVRSWKIQVYIQGNIYVFFFFYLVEWFFCPSLALQIIKLSTLVSNIFLDFLYVFNFLLNLLFYFITNWILTWKE